MSIARETYFIYLRNLKTWLAQPAALISTILMSAFMFLLFGAPLSGMTQIPGFPSDNYEAYLTGMVIIMAVVFNGSDVAFALLTDMLSGYFDKLLLAPVNRFSILMGTLLVAGTRALVQVVVIVGMAFALGVTFAGGILGVLTIIVVATTFGVATACLGLIIALRTKSVQVTQSSWLLFMPLAFLTTAFMPKELLSGWFKVAVTLNPVDYVMEGVRTIIIEGWALGLHPTRPLGADGDHGDHANRGHMVLPSRNGPGSPVAKRLPAGHGGRGVQRGEASDRRSASARRARG